MEAYRVNIRFPYIYELLKHVSRYKILRPIVSPRDIQSIAKLAYSYGDAANIDYDFDYDLNNDTNYCSEFVARVRTEVTGELLPYGKIIQPSEIANDEKRWETIIEFEA
jgi:hypothetical protein